MNNYSHINMFFVIVVRGLLFLLLWTRSCVFAFMLFIVTAHACLSLQLSLLLLLFYFILFILYCFVIIAIVVIVARNSPPSNAPPRGASRARL